MRPALVNGAIGTVTLRDAAVRDRGLHDPNRRVVEMDIFADPERLSRVDLQLLD